MVRFAIGIDVHKSTCNAHMVCADYGKDSQRIRDFIGSFNERFGTFPTGALDFIEMARILKGRQCSILIENSTKGHDVYWTLRNLDLDVYVAHSTDLYRINKSVVKRDERDCIELAGYMRRKLNGEIEFAESFIPSPEWMRRREMCRFLADEKLELTKTKKQIRAHLLLHGMHLKKEHTDITSRVAMAELADFGDAVLLMYLDRAKNLKQRIRFTEKAILAEFIGLGMFDIIFSLPGAGIMTAAYLTSMITDASRFCSKKEFSASFGLTPKMYSSGESDPECGITRRGDDLARRLIYQMTFVHIRFAEDSHIRTKYYRLKANGKKHNEAIVASANSLLHVLYSMLRDGRTYVSDPERLKNARKDAESLTESEISVSRMDLREDMVCVD